MHTRATYCDPRSGLPVAATWAGVSWLVFLAACLLALTGCTESAAKHGAADLEQLTSPATADSSGGADRADKVSGDGSQNPARAADAAGAPTATADPASPPPADDRSDPARPATPAAAAPRNDKPVHSLPPPAPPQLYKPVVVLSESHAATCLVGVGQPMPDFKLPDLDGEPHSLGELLGERLTLVVFWSNQNRFGREQFRRLPSEVLPFSERGLRVVAINVGDPAEQVADLREPGAEAIACLLDSDGRAFAEVATERLPRTYLLDAEGTVLWFDLEYSRTMRRELENALYYFSQPDAEGDS